MAGLRLGSASDPEGLAGEFHRTFAWMYLKTERTQLAEQAAEEALRLALASGHFLDSIESLVGLANARLARDCGNDDVGALSLSSLGVAEQLAGNWTRAVRCHEEALDDYRKTNRLDNQLATLFNLGEIARERHDLAEAESHFKAALEIAGRMGDSITKGMVFRDLDEIALGRNDCRSFVRRMHDGLPLVEEAGLRHEVASHLRLSGILGMRCGGGERAEKELEESLRLAREAGSALHEVQALRDWASCLLPRGRRREGEEKLAEGRRIVRSSGLRKEAREIERILRRSDSPTPSSSSQSSFQE